MQKCGEMLGQLTCRLGGARRLREEPMQQRDGELRWPFRAQDNLDKSQMMMINHLRWHFDEEDCDKSRMIMKRTCEPGWEDEKNSCH